MAEFSLETHSNHCRHRIEIKGELDLSKASALESAMNEIIDQRMRHGDFVVVNLSQVAYIDAHNIGLLIDSQRKIEHKYGTLCLVISDKIKRVFNILGILKVMPVVESENQIGPMLAC